MHALWALLMRHKLSWMISTLVLVALVVALALLLKRDDSSTFFYDAY